MNYLANEMADNPALTTDLIIKISSTSMAQPPFIGSIMILDTHLSKLFPEFKNVLMKTLNNQAKDCLSLIQNMCRYEIIIIVILSLLMIVEVTLFSRVTSVLKRLILFLPPGEVMANTKLFKLLVGDTMDKNTVIMSPAESVLSVGTMGTVLLTPDFSITTVNDAFTKITGLTHDDLIGQSIQVIFPPDQDPHLAKLYQAMNDIFVEHHGNLEATEQQRHENAPAVQAQPFSLLSNQNLMTQMTMMSSSFESLAQGGDDENDEESDDKNVYRVSIQAISGNHIIADCSIHPLFAPDDTIDAFVILFRDRSEETALFDQLSCEMERSEHILQNLLPQVAYTALRLYNPQTFDFSNVQDNPFEHEINTEDIEQSMESFEINNGENTSENLEKYGVFVSDYLTIITVSIEGLLESVQNLLPSDLFSVTTRIYTLFDDFAKQYPITRIESIDNLIIGCIGLFDRIEPQEQAKIACQFALALNQSMDDVNIQLSTDLTLAILIHGGGPAVGSLMNSATPIFSLESHALNECVYFCKQYAKICVVSITQTIADALGQNVPGINFVNQTKVPGFLGGESQNIIEIDRP
jgi:PAS domain-containing protein